MDIHGIHYFPMESMESDGYPILHWPPTLLDHEITSNNNLYHNIVTHSNHRLPFLLPSRYSTTDSSLYGTSELVGISHLYQGCLLNLFEFRILNDLRHFSFIFGSLIDMLDFSEHGLLSELVSMFMAFVLSTVLGR